MTRFALPYIACRHLLCCNTSTTDFEHKILLWQMLSITIEQCIVQCTTFLLATIHSNGTKFPLSPQASKSALSFKLPSHRHKVYTSLSCSPVVHHHNKSHILNLYPDDSSNVYHRLTLYIGWAAVKRIAGRRK